MKIYVFSAINEKRKKKISKPKQRERPVRFIYLQQINPTKGKRLKLPTSNSFIITYGANKLVFYESGQSIHVHFCRQAPLIKFATSDKSNLLEINADLTRNGENRIA